MYVFNCCPPKRISTTCCWLTTIERIDDIHVRTIFQQQYEAFFSEYPSIRKMVKSALGKDLLSDATTDTNVNDDQNNKDGNIIVSNDLQKSSIGLLLACWIKPHNVHSKSHMAL